MNARSITAVAVMVVASAVNATALAAGAAKDPKTLVLQKSDFLPVAARRTNQLRDKSPQYSSYFVTYRYRAGAKVLELQSWAIVMDNSRFAARSFREIRSELSGEGKASLPPYGGDEQVAALAREDNEGQLWVRTGGTVWGISVNTAGVGNWGLITKAESIAQLKRFGPKQMKRVGSG